MLLNLNNFKTPINEVYFGKQKELLAMENQLDIFRNKYMGRFVANPLVNNDSDLLKFNRMVEDFFGFGCFAFTIINIPMANAMTLPIDYRYDVISTRANLIANPKTFKFAKEANYACIVYMYSGMIFNEAYTTEEIMAFIMHEIGHNFFTAINSKFGILIKVYVILDIILKLYQIVAHPSNVIKIAKSVVNSTNLYQSLVTKFSQTLRENNHILIILSDYVAMFSQYGQTIFGGLIKFIDMITLGLPKLALSIFSTVNQAVNPLTWVALIMPYNNERVADNFAAMYGYGPALASGLEKTSNAYTKSPSKMMNTFNKIPLVSNLYSINVQLSSVIVHAFDPHPVDISRAADQLALLEREANKADLDPKMKKVILEDCKAIKSKINLLIEYSDGIEDKNLVRNAYYRALYNNSNSKALKDLLFDDINKFAIYDKSYDIKK